MSRRAGLTIRHLARFRCFLAIANFVLAALLLIVTPLLFFFLGSGYVAIAALIFAINFAFCFICAGFIYWGQARRAFQGALGEEQLEVILGSLVSKGWIIEYNFPLRRTDADVFLSSPTGRYYVIDAKSHKGGVVFFDPQFQRLRRRYGTAVYDFEQGSYGRPKDFLKLVKSQAFQLAQSKHLSWVSPIICFTGQVVIDSAISIDQPLQGVYVVSKSRILYLLDVLERCH
jgi:hypothetical protein